MSPRRLSGDAGVGLYAPDDVRAADFDRVDSALIDALRACSGVTATVSDVLDELGWATTVSAESLVPRHEGAATAVGQALTLRYLPARRHVLHEGWQEAESRLSHAFVYSMAQPGDFVVIEASSESPVSVLGGLAAAGAAHSRLGGVVVDGAVRDIDQIRDAGVALWSRWVTPRSGKTRMEAVAVNGPLHAGGVQVRPGDLVVADGTGVCFVPLEIASAVAARVVEVSADEAQELS